MSTSIKHHVYTVFYINKDGQYETMYPESIWGIPEKLRKESTYVYTHNSHSHDGKTTNWFYFKGQKPPFEHVIWSWIYDLNVLPQEVKALALLSGIYEI